MSKVFESIVTALWCVFILSHLINDFGKLLQGGAHHLIITTQRKTLQTTATIWSNGLD